MIEKHRITLLSMLHTGCFSSFKGWVKWMHQIHLGYFALFIRYKPISIYVVLMLTTSWRAQWPTGVLVQMDENNLISHLSYQNAWLQISLTTLATFWANKLTHDKALLPPYPISKTKNVFLCVKCKLLYLMPYPHFPHAKQQRFYLAQPLRVQKNF